MSINKADVRPSVDQQIIATATSLDNVPTLRGPGLYSVRMGLPSGETVCYLVQASRDGGIKFSLDVTVSSSLKPFTQTAEDELTINPDSITLQISKANARFTLRSNPTRTIDLVMKKIF